MKLAAVISAGIALVAFLVWVIRREHGKYTGCE